VEAKSPLLRHSQKAAEVRETLDEAIRQQAMAGLPPVKSAQLTGSRRPILSGCRLTKNAIETPRKVYQDRVAVGRANTSSGTATLGLWMLSHAQSWGSQLGTGFAHHTLDARISASEWGAPRDAAYKCSQQELREPASCLLSMACVL
jgi:hypothetical protein